MRHQQGRVGLVEDVLPVRQRRPRRVDLEHRQKRKHDSNHRPDKHDVAEAPQNTQVEGDVHRLRTTLAVAGAEECHSRLGPVRHAELSKDGCQVKLHRVDGDIQLLAISAFVRPLVVIASTSCSRAESASRWDGDGLARDTISRG